MSFLTLVQVTQQESLFKARKETPPLCVKKPNRKRGEELIPAIFVSMSFFRRVVSMNIRLVLFTFQEKEDNPNQRQNK